MRKRSNRMMFLVFSVVLLTSALVIANVFSVTVLSQHMRSGTDISQYSKESSIRTEIIHANRGVIYDSKGNIIAQDVETYNLRAYLSPTRMAPGNKPAYVVDPVATARALSPILGMDEEVLFNYLSKEGIYQTEIGVKGRNLSLEVKNQIEALGLPGIEFYQTKARYYPQGIFSSHIIGFAQYDMETEQLVGRMGLEAIFDEELNGVDGYIKYVSNKNGYRLPGAQITTVPAEHGNNLYLTLNKTVQMALEESLAVTMTMFDTSKAWGTVVEVETGKIIAIGGYPTFDPKTLEIEEYTILGSQYVYEPGSTMKTFTYAAAIDTGVYNGTDIFDSGPFKMGIKNGKAIRVTGDSYIEIINNANKRDWGWIDFNHGYRYSSNVAIAELLTKVLDPKVYEEYLDRFGFFKKVDVDGLPEAAGTKNYNYPFEKLALGYGQGSSVTMLQIVQAYTAILNDGLMVKPYLVQQIKDPVTNESIYNAETTIVGQPIKAETAKQVQDLMYDVVNTSDGSGRFYMVEEVEVLAKTGTAQIYQNNTYDNNRVIVSVVLGFPAEDPKILIYYAFECEYSNQVHVQTDPIKKLILSTALEYNFIHNNPVTDPEEHEYHQVENYVMPALANHNIEYANEKLNGLQSEIVYLGQGKQVVAQYPEAGEMVLSNQPILLLTDGTDILMPDMTGWSRKEVMAFWAMTNIEIYMNGFGLVVEQDILPGSLLYKDTIISLKLK